MMSKAWKFIKDFNSFSGLLIFILLLLYIPFPTNELREPIAPYQTLEDEYIAAIEEFIETDHIAFPENAIFTYDIDNIKLTDKTSGAKLSCRFALNGTVPVYTWSYSRYDTLKVFKIVAVELWISLISMFIIRKIIEMISSMMQRKQFKNLSNKKSSAKFGDMRRYISNNTRANCTSCCYNSDCKCLKCMYLGYCGNCPSLDCESDFEEQHQNKLSENNDNNNDKEEKSDESKDCEACDKHETCECNYCPNDSECKSCPSDNCLLNFEDKN